MASQDYDSTADKTASGKSVSTSSGRPARRILPWLLVVAIAAIAAFLLLRNEGAEEGKPGGRFGADGRPVPVIAATAKRRDVDVYLDALGTVTPRNAVVVKSRVDGQLMQLYFREGEMVKQGELLAQVDPRPFEAQLAQAQGQLARDQALLDNALLDLERYQTLLAQDSIARQQVDTQTALVSQYRGAVAVDRALIDTAKLQLVYSKITAPISGKVGLRQVDPGNMISSNDANGIVSITQLQPITVLFNIPEDNLPALLERMKLDKEVPVTAFSRSQTTQLARGKLLTIDNQIDPTTGTIKLRALFQNDEGTLFPNQFVNVRMLVNVEKNVIVVPVPALQRGRSGNYVYVIKGDTVSLRSVKAGAASGEVVVIESGLEPGEVVVVDGADKLREGAKVKPAFNRRDGQENGVAGADKPAQAVVPDTGQEGARQPRGKP
jgi:multidrug efflux system membrane fusion protein